MEPIALTIVGAGSVQCGPAIIGSLASYFGERPLEVRLYDADEERLDLFDRLARLVFGDTVVEHHLKSYTDAVEALDGSRLVVLALDHNCARKYLRQTDAPVPIDDDEALREAVDRIMPTIPAEALLLSLLPTTIPVAQPMYYRVGWPPPVDEEACRSIPFQILRWLNKEEGVYALVDAHERSPFKQWLDDPSTAEPVIGTVER
ncbi:MAG: hypothetical protein ACO1SV_26910 [Fimbriimonas sp.]